MTKVVVTELAPDEKTRHIFELVQQLAGDLHQGVDAIVVLTVVQSGPTTVDERLRSVFDIVENEESIKILERWCAEARQLLELHKKPPGGSA